MIFLNTYKKINKKENSSTALIDKINMIISKFLDEILKEIKI